MTLALAAALLAPIAAQNLEVELQRATQKETVTGDLKAAIDEYKKIASRAGSNRKVAVQALVHMAECYQKLGDTESRRIYERVVRDFADQKEAAATARTRLGGGSELKNTGVMTRQAWTGSGVDLSGSPSPDGRYLTFINWGTGDLGVRDLSTGTNRLLTNTGGWAASGDYPGRSIVSPDGRQVAYAWFQERERRNELRILPLAGVGGETARPRTLHRTEGSHDYVEPYGWSPDGKQLLVIHTLPDRTSQVAMLSVVDGSIRAIKSFAWQQPNPSLSPDGRLIAFEAPTGDNASQRDIFVLAADGSREAAVVQNPSQDRFPVWSPDGSRLVFMSLRTGSYSLWSVPIESGKASGPAELVKADVGRMRPLGITRKGSLYYGLSGSQDTNVHIAELDTELKAAKAPVPATDRFVNSNVGPAWSPDGQSLAWYSFGNPAAGSIMLTIRSQKTGEERGIPLRLPVMSLFNAGPMWFPDGRSVLVLAGDGQRRQFYRVDLASGNAELLHSTNNQSLSSYRLSPDGKTIFYCFQNDGASDEGASGLLMRFDIGSAGPVVLKKDQWFISLAVSPDGAQLAYLVSQRPGSSSSISVIPATGGETREVYRGTNWMDGSRYNTLAWSPDQRYLVFVNASVDASAPSVLWRVPATGGAPEKMGISMSARIKSPAIHPDGRRIAFGSTDGDSGEVWVLENFLSATSAKK